MTDNSFVPIYEVSSSKNSKKEEHRRKKCLSAVPSRSRKSILPPLDVTFKPMTQLDIDPQFYSMVRGRPIKSNESIRLYKENIRNVTRSKISRGFILDEILRIDKEIETENTVFEVACNHFDEYKKSFERFLADDNTSTMDIIKHCDNTAKQLAITTEKHKKSNYEVATLKSKLQYIDESRLILLSYEKFLHKISPLWWQTEHNIVKYNQPTKELIVLSSDIFSKMNPDEIQKQLDDRLEPALFFERSKQLPLVFEMLEKQNLNYLLMTEEMNAHLMKVFKGSERLKIFFNNEAHFIQEEVDEIEEEIAWNESRELELKQQFYKVLKDNLEYLIASKTALQLYYYVEYVYEHVITENDTNQSTREMFHALEKEYKDMMYDLEGIDIVIVKEIENEAFTEDSKTMKEAQYANKLLKNLDKIRKRLAAAYDHYEKRNI